MRSDVMRKRAPSLAAPSRKQSSSSARHEKHVSNDRSRAEGFEAALDADKLGGGALQKNAQVPPRSPVAVRPRKPTSQVPRLRAKRPPSVSSAKTAALPKPSSSQFISHLPSPLFFLSLTKFFTTDTVRQPLSPIDSSGQVDNHYDQVESRPRQARSGVKGTVSAVRPGFAKEGNDNARDEAFLPQQPAQSPESLELERHIKADTDGSGPVRLDGDQSSFDEKKSAEGNAKRRGILKRRLSQPSKKEAPSAPFEVSPARKRQRQRQQQQQQQEGRKRKRKRREVKFMTDSRSDEQHGNNRAQQAMDARNTDVSSTTTAINNTAAGSSTASGAATQSSTQQSAVTPSRVTLSSKPQLKSFDSASQLDETNEGLKRDSASSRSRRSTSLPPSTHVMGDVSYGDGVNDPLSLIGKEDRVGSIRPHPSEHLISMYGLSSLAASVARYDPLTGEKINKLRKSYEGHVAKLGISGRNKSVKRQPDEEGKRLDLTDMMMYPAEEWKIQRASKTPLSRGWNNSGSWDVTQEFKAKLEKAFHFETLPVPHALNQEWEQALGHEKPRGKASKPGVIKAGATANGTQRVNGTPSASTPTTAAAAAAGISRTSTPVNAPNERLRRAGKRRRYTEDAYEGYNESFQDDSEGADSSNEGSHGGKKRRRKDSSAAAAAPPRPQGRMGSYGPGMIHSTGIGAYGR